jgi:hypothetical protein
MPNTTVPSPLVSRSSAAGASVDGASVDGASVDGASVEGASVDGASVDGASVEVASPDVVSVLESSSSSPQAAMTRLRAATAAMNFFDVLMMLPRKTGVLS